MPPTCSGRRCRSRHASRGPERSRVRPPRSWDWLAPPPGPAGWRRTSVTISLPASSASPRCRFRPGTRETSSPAPTCAGWKFRGRWRSSRNSSRRCPRGRCGRDVAGPLKPDHLVVSLVEGWRGEICHVALTDGQGRFSRYKIVDPSFHNWIGLAMALRDQQISDFPLCNKSFNLSYCGHDL